MAKKSGLSAEDVDSLRSQLDGGTQPLVWFTAAAVGMEAGRSAKLMARSSGTIVLCSAPSGRPSQRGQAGDRAGGGAADRSTGASATITSIQPARWSKYQAMRRSE